MSDPIKLRCEISTEEQIPILSDWLKDPAVSRWFPMINEREIEDAAKVWIGYYGKTFQSAFSVFQEDELVGFFCFYLTAVQKLRHQALFSIIVHPNLRGKGIGMQMLKMIKQKAKEEFQLELLHLEVYKENPARRLYERVGFETYGEHKNFLKEEDGSYRDKILMQKWL